jgi:hypothetical protein
MAADLPKYSDFDSIATVLAGFRAKCHAIRPITIDLSYQALTATGVLNAVELIKLSVCLGL